MNASIPRSASSTIFLNSDLLCHSPSRPSGWREEQNIGYDSVAIGYITRQTGGFHLLSKGERDALYTAPNNATRNELVESFSEGYHNIEKWKPSGFSISACRKISERISASPSLPTMYSVTSHWSVIQGSPRSMQEGILICSLVPRSASNCKQSTAST